MEITDIESLCRKAVEGGELTEAELYGLLDVPRQALRDAAAAVTAARHSRRFDTCSIINARSGRCPENCKWCAQSAHYSTGCEVYPLIDEETCLDAARIHASQGIRRFSAVTSGRAARGGEVERIGAMMARCARETGIEPCASLGLLSREDLQRLWDAGVRRYHCNLETAPSFFPTLCTTHSIDDKLATIAAAREIGFEVCSGGIIGMGESPRQRVEFAITLRKAHPVSIPVNILSPIPGTPLEGTPPISDDEIVDTVAILRLAHPDAVLRFAGGRRRLSDEVQQECMRVGVNGALMGDMLTTVGNGVDEDRRAIARAGYIF